MADTSARTANTINSIVIAGGGTAGWMAAAALAHHFKTLTQFGSLPRAPHITLVESEAIGTVGVGEATIPSIRAFNDSLGIDELDFIKKTHATFKLGIEFRDWHQIDTEFFHPFADYGMPLKGVKFHHHLIRLQLAGEKINTADYSFPAQLAKQGRFAQPHPNPPTPLANYGYAYHFDAGRYALYLREYAEQRGVIRREGKIDNVVLDHTSGDIASLKLDSGEQLNGDLFIDCTGFRGLLIEQALHTGYDDWRQWLPCDRAIAVQSEKVGDPAPYTRTTAREAGWQWRIPLQHRTGNGYVYSSAFCDATEAEQTLLSGIDGAAIKAPRSFEFVTGKRKKIWHKNCYALGLASGFLEPLESTSISLIQTGISRLLAFFPHQGYHECDVDEVNRQHHHEFERIRDFLILHYKATSRSDTEFWRHCQSMAIPDTLQHKMALYQSRGHLVSHDPEAFEPDSWISMYMGFQVKAGDYDRRADAIELDALKQQLAQIRETIRQAASQPMSHADFIARHCAAEQ
ncbi:tryptophan halogenase family protein [Gilvimarinus agarilyticus]|uniref:tryptophan halogenase family protein n=1 Tax=Gilvimarinus agarilyticus TaxID=679259 RepID=UPI000AD43319|nr:tryptophan halogenase family protein [Gilvimarinus agarilyticus]